MHELIIFQALVQESQAEKSNLSEQLRNEERQNEANNQTIGNLQRELQTLQQTVTTQQKQLDENKVSTKLFNQ